uniref:uncharacterized protein LOC122607069 isoform X1 n=1 Tax=Erigeron canadensis TaxID=72917 RepID=UPI001CB96F36|nr:uncharacterized protein LOC122607069 isoform X1 [Erigeron canadensis]
MDNKDGSKSSSSEEQPPPTFGYFCTDNEFVNMDMKCVYESECMYGYLKATDERIAYDEEEEVPSLRHEDPRDISYTGKVTCPSDVALLVNTYCVGRFNIMRTHQHDDGVDLLAKKLMEFDTQFVQDMTPILLVLLLNVAVQLRIDSLINLMLNTMHEGGFADAILNMPAIKDSKIPFFNRYIFSFDAIEMSERDSF